MSSGPPLTPIRIAHLVSDDGWGGAEAMISNLIEFQRGQDELETRLIALNDGRLCELARSAGIAVNVIPEAQLSNAALASALRRKLKDLEPDVVHSHRYKENLLGCWLARSLGFKCVITVHGHEPAEGAWARFKFGMRFRLSWALARRVDAQIVAVSEDLRSIFEFSSEECRVIPNAVRIPEVPVAHARTHERPVVGWIGRMVPIKDVPLLMDAFAALPADLDRARLLLVGDGPEREVCERHAERIGIVGRVDWAGFVAETQPFLERMTVFALPSRHEGLPIAMLEAMAAAVPCVVASVGGIPAAIGDSGGASLIESRTVADWTLALERTLRNSEDAEQMGQRARSRVRDCFSLERCAAQYLDCYRDALGVGPAALP